MCLREPSELFYNDAAKRKKSPRAIPAAATTCRATEVWVASVCLASRRGIAPSSARPGVLAERTHHLRHKSVDDHVKSGERSLTRSVHDNDGNEQRRRTALKLERERRPSDSDNNDNEKPKRAALKLERERRPSDSGWFARGGRVALALLRARPRTRTLTTSRRLPLPRKRVVERKKLKNEGLK